MRPIVQQAPVQPAAANIMQAPAKADPEQSPASDKIPAAKSGRNSVRVPVGRPSAAANTTAAANSTTLPPPFPEYVPRHYDLSFRGAIAYVGGKHEDGTETDPGGSSGGAEDPLSAALHGNSWGEQDKGQPKHGILVDRQNGGGLKTLQNQKQLIRGKSLSYILTSYS